MKNTNRQPVFEQLECRRLMAVNPTGHEQEMLQLFNRFRSDPQGEFNRLFSSVSPLRARDTSLQAELDRNNVSGAMLRDEWNAIAASEPLVWNEGLYNFAASHNADMIRLNSGFHSNAQTRHNAIRAAGIDFVLEGELVSLRATNPIQGYAVYAVNWGTNPATGRSRGGMQDPRGHRTILVTPGYDQIGHRVSNTTASNLSPSVNTAVLVDTRNMPLMVTGAVFEDKNNNGWYENTEGRGSVKVDFEKTTGEKFTTTSLSAGGYQIALAPGTYKVRATGGGMAHAVVQTITVSDKSLWRNLIYKPTDPPPDSQEPNDSRLTPTILTGQSPSLNNLSLHRDSDVDFFKYVAVGTGMATYEVTFTNSQGNVDLEVLDASGNVLARSNTTGNKESITLQAEAGKTYFLRVFGKANPKYDLKIVGPPAVAPDSREPNNTLATATVLSGHSPTVGGVSLHSNFDVDYFKYVAQGTGVAKFDVEFTHAGGNVDLQLLDTQGTVLATAAGAGNVETLTRNVQRSVVYYLKVYGGPNATYSLKIAGPTLRPPVANDDRAMSVSGSPITINIINNDSNPDGTLAQLVPSLASNAPPAFRLNTNRTLNYQSTSGYTGIQRTTYTVTNTDGLTSQSANIQVIVIDYSRPAPWQHPTRPNDTNDDGRVSSLDALLIINELNSGRDQALPRSGTTTLASFIDTNGDGRMAAFDALRVINELNQPPSGAGEGEPAHAVVRSAHYPNSSSPLVDEEHRRRMTDIALTRLMNEASLHTRSIQGSLQ